MRLIRLRERGGRAVSQSVVGVTGAVGSAVSSITEGLADVSSGISCNLGELGSIVEAGTVGGAIATGGGVLTYVAYADLAAETDSILIFAGVAGVAGDGLIIGAGVGVTALIIYAGTPS